MMENEKRLDADKVRHIIERHIADVIYRGIGHIPSGKDSNSAYEFLRGYEEGAKYIANLILREDNLVDAVEFDYRAGYDFIMALQKELASKHYNELGLLDYTSVKALAATYELQDYLANRIAKAVAEGELDPDPEE